MLETLHTQDYYLSMAERYPPFEAVIAGDDSLVSWIDWAAEEFGCIVKNSHHKPAGDASVRLEVLCELFCGDASLKGDLPGVSVERLFLNGVGYATASGIVTYLAGIAAMTFIPPPLGVVIGFALAAVATPLGGIYAGLRGMGSRVDRVVEMRKEALQPLYCAAESLGADISRCFILDDFHSRRDRFGLTYRSLSGEERAEVKQELCRRLEAGALDMGEAELDMYLSSLKESGVAPDA